MQPRSASMGPPSKGAPHKRVVVGVCAMAKKTTSKPMCEILSRLPEAIFRIEIFEESMILEAAIEDWPVCDCLIAFYSTGYPLEKAVAYYALRRPYCVNDLAAQTILRDRRSVYETLTRAGIPTPRYVAMSRDRKRGGGGEECTLEEHDDYIVVNGVRVEKPFVEKPTDADDHNIHIYYPMSAGGGCKQLFRKVNNKSSHYDADCNAVRREGSYIYEEFVDTQGTDVKVYAVGPNYGHAEARKSPALDGIVMRGEDGKELRYPVILSWFEKDIAFRIFHAFKQLVCGFDILRTHDGRTLVCDVNGWSFVKKSRKYYDDCAAVLTIYMESKRPLLMSPRGSENLLAGSKKKKCASAPGSSSLLGSQAQARPAFRRSDSQHSRSGGTMDDARSTSSKVSENEFTDDDAPTPPRRTGGRELRCVIAVVRHGDRTPKRKLKLKTTNARLLAVHSQHSKSSRLEAKIRESKDLRGFAETLRLTQLECTDDIEDQAFSTQLSRFLDVLDSHVPNQSSLTPAGVSALNTALFTGIKIQIKPTAWLEEICTTFGDEVEIVSEASTTSGEPDHPTRVVSEVQLVLKWGGVLTEVGVEHATALGEHFRRSMYPSSEDGQGLLRLHATFRHDLKIRTSDEGRVMKTGAAFTKGLLELEGDISPILVSLIHRGRSDVNMLDRGGNHEAQDLLNGAKLHVENTFQLDVDLDEDLCRLIAPDGPDSVIAALLKLGNPRKALELLYELVDGLVDAIEKKQQDALPLAKKLYMGEPFRVWLDSWSDVRRELRKKKKKDKKKDKDKKEEKKEDVDWWKYDLSKIPEIFDKVRFDAQHNAGFLGIREAYPRFDELVRHAETLSSAVTPLEFGGAAKERCEAAWRISHVLIEKIRQDLHMSRGGSGDPNHGLHFQLDDDPMHLSEHEVKSTWRAVRTRLYFTSESHLHALLTALRLPCLLVADDTTQEQASSNPASNSSQPEETVVFGPWAQQPGSAQQMRRASSFEANPQHSVIAADGQRWLSGIKELSYLSHIVFRLWEDFDIDPALPERFMVELSFSPGTPFAHDDADADSDEEAAPPPPRHPSSTEPLSEATSKAAKLSAAPLNEFAYVPSVCLEDYFDVTPQKTSEETMIATAAKYGDLANRLAKAAARQQEVKKAAAE